MPRPTREACCRRLRATMSAGGVHRRLPEALAAFSFVSLLLFPAKGFVTGPGLAYPPSAGGIGFASDGQRRPGVVRRRQSESSPPSSSPELTTTRLLLTAAASSNQAAAVLGIRNVFWCGGSGGNAFAGGALASRGDAGAAAAAAAAASRQLRGLGARRPASTAAAAAAASAAAAGPGSAGSGGSSPLDMLWSGGRRTRPDEVTVNIERTSLNSRRISGSIVVDAPIEDVWLVLTDYDKLAEYVPNLTQSRLVPHPRGGIRLFQEGAQKIVGFDFRASLVMDMEEKYGEADDRLAQRKITFKLVDSGMFNDFDGEWRLQFNSRQVNRDALPGEDRYKYTTKLFYMVYIRPRGPVPVLALEWQIGQEVPNNLAAVKKAAEMMGTDAAWVRRRLDESARFRVAKAAEAAAATAGPGGASPAAQADWGNAAAVMSRVNGNGPALMTAATAGATGTAAAASAAEGRSPPRADWEKDETLEAYIQKISKGSK